MAFLLVRTTLVARGRTQIHMALAAYEGIALVGVLVVSLVRYVQAHAAASCLDSLFTEGDSTIGIGLMVTPLLAYDFYTVYTEARAHPATLTCTGAAGRYLAVELS